MRFKSLLFFVIVSLVAAGIVAVCLTPFLVAAGLRIWLTRIAQQEQLRIEFQGIEAPFLRPVVIRKLQISGLPNAPLQLTIDAPRVELDLSFAALLSPSRGRFLHAIRAETLRADVQRNQQSPVRPQPVTGRIIEYFLADNFSISGLGLHLEDGETTIDLHNGTLTGTEIGTGVFNASDITIVSPWLQKSFTQLRGVTSWQDNRLSIGALTLTQGLDLDFVNIDLSQIGKNRLALEMALDAFGGKIRARISGENQSGKRTWDVAGNASEISLAQMSDALDLTDRASGSLHACKFTFRGEPVNLREATATVWAEVAGLTWRDRTADTIMIGASLYNHQIQIEQLFVKQRNNQFNLNGESSLPQKWSDWLKPDFRGDISASIQDLGDFARLFGGRPADFSGKINIAGSVDARERKLGGHLSVTGDSLRLFRAPFESLSLEGTLKESRLEIAPFELRRRNDSVQGRATLDLTGEHGYTFDVTSSVTDIADYTVLLPEALRGIPLGGGLDFSWKGSGTAEAHSGTFEARGHRLRALDSAFIPFDLEFAGEYRPENIFFRKFNLSTPRVALSAFITVADTYFQVQSLNLTLDGQSKLWGDVFLPLSLWKLGTQNGWQTALDATPRFDVDLTLDSTDLGAMATGLSTHPAISGQGSGTFVMHGVPASINGKASVRLRDFFSGNMPRVSFELDAQAVEGIVSGKAVATARGSDPVCLEGSMPLRLERRESGYAFETGGPLSATLDFPVISFSRLPAWTSGGLFSDGILSGQLNLSDVPGRRLMGNVHLINGRLWNGSTLSSGVTFSGETAAIDFVRIVKDKARYFANGEIDFRNRAAISARLRPSLPLTMLPSLEPRDCIDGIEFLPVSLNVPQPLINEIVFRGGLFASDWTISLEEKETSDPLETLRQGISSRAFPFCHDDDRASGKKLSLGLAPFLF